MIESLGGRKFIFALLAIILAFVLVVMKLVDPDRFLQFVSLIGGIYVVGNVATYGLSEYKGDKSTKEEEHDA